MRLFICICSHRDTGRLCPSASYTATICPCDQLGIRNPSWDYLFGSPCLTCLTQDIHGSCIHRESISWYSLYSVRTDEPPSCLLRNPCPEPAFGHDAYLYLCSCCVISFSCNELKICKHSHSGFSVSYRTLSNHHCYRAYTDWGKGKLLLHENITNRSSELCHFWGAQGNWKNLLQPPTYALLWQGFLEFVFRQIDKDGFIDTNH